MTNVTDNDEDAKKDLASENESYSQHGMSENPVEKEQNSTKLERLSEE